ncbi:MAG: phospholipid carrier-dependent glycosyltransferase, partial [Holophagales bacterium]|nr:phospholipid carrier-dependent glycosyltransferase [Holophagales bacterium]
MSRFEPAGEGEALETRPGASPGLRGPLAAAVLALAVHGLFLSALPAGLRGNDSADYESFYRPVARSWLAGDGLVSPDGDPAVRYPPGFPALLALTFAVGDSLGFGEPAATRLMNALFVALGAAAFTMLARSFCRRRWAARLATGLWITYPPLLWLGKQPSSEMPFFFFVFLSAWSGRKAFLRVERPESRYSSPLRATLPRPALAWAALAGASAGVATLLRPAALLLALPALAAVILARARIRRRAAVLAVGLLCQAAILLPW